MKASSRISVFQRFFLRDKQFRNRLYVFMLCVLFSSLFWLIVQFSKDYEETINVPIVFTHPPNGKVLSSVSDTSLIVRLSVKGLKIFTLRYLEPPERFVVDMQNVKLKKVRNNAYAGLLLTTQLSQLLTDQSSVKGKIISIDPDTIYLEFEKIKTKRLAIKPLFKYELANQVMLYDSIVCMPDSVDVKGPAAILDTLKYISTTTVDAGIVSENKQLVAELVHPVKYIPLQFSHSYTTISILAEKFTEANVEIPIVTDSIGKCKLKTFPEKSIVTVRVPLKEFKNLDPLKFRLTVSCLEASTTTGNKLRVKAAFMPRHTRLIRIEPNEVEFLIMD
jgi:hypothetical protein